MFGVSDRPQGRWERGASAAELALVAVVLFFLLLGIVDIGRIVYLQQSVSTAAYEIARAVAGTPTLTSSELRQVVSARVPALDADQLSIHVSRDEKTREVTVTVTYPYEPVVPFLAPRDHLIRATVHLTY